MHGIWRKLWGGVSVDCLASYTGQTSLVLEEVLGRTSLKLRNPSGSDSWSSLLSYHAAHKLFRCYPCDFSRSYGATSTLVTPTPKPHSPWPVLTPFSTWLWPEIDLIWTALGLIWGQIWVKLRSKSGRGGGQNRVGVSGVWGWVSSRPEYSSFEKLQCYPLDCVALLLIKLSSLKLRYVICLSQAELVLLLFRPGPFASDLGQRDRQDASWPWSTHCTHG